MTKGHLLPARAAAQRERPVLPAGGLRRTSRLAALPLRHAARTAAAATRLSRLAAEVVSVERYRTLAEAARTRIETLGYTNVTIVVGDGMEGAPDFAPFDRILVTAAAEEIPEALIAQLAEGGKMVLPVGPRDATQYIVKLHKQPGGELVRDNLIAVRFVPLLPGRAREL